MRIARLAVLAAALACIVGAQPLGASTTTAARPAPKLKNPTATGHALVDRFFFLIEHKDRASLEKFLAPGFQVQRADGSGSGKAAWLANLATINSYTLTEVKGTQAGGSLVVRYLAKVEGMTNGKPYTPGPAPRLSVFSWSGTAWQLAAHANFNPLTG
jgi:Domain of unknown function (DUF4440)